MLVLVLGANFLVMFVGWEGVGLCSYLLIGFWFRRSRPPTPARRRSSSTASATSAFILGMLLLFVALRHARLPGRSRAPRRRSAPKTTFGTLSLITLLLFIGATGKSAQIPLYVWLPDAMEGPTPVSALIHAATMVTAGVYMIGRNAVLFSHAPQTLTIVAVIGAATALMAGTIGLVQNDIKRVLAYSTVSQLGYMFLAMGVGAYAAGIFHLYTHAFFKALLFLGSGAVIHALAGEQDLRNMGGLKKELPITYWTFLIGALAIAGVPLLAGFFSKDEILFATFASGHTPAVGRRPADVAADGDLHVPAGVPDVPRRAARSARRRASDERSRHGTTRTARTAHARARRTHGHHLHDAPPAMAIRADRAGGRIGPRRLRRRAARARRQQPASSASSSRASSRARPPRDRAGARRTPARPSASRRPAVGETPRRARLDRADADGGLERRRARRHRHRGVLLAEEPRRRRRDGAQHSRRLPRCC